MRRFTTLALISLIGSIALPALAQDVPPPPDAASPVVVGVDLDQAPLALVPVVASLVKDGRWGLLALVGLFAAVWAVRKFASKLHEGKVRDALTSRWGGWALNVAMALAGGFASLLATGAPITAVGVVSVLGAAVSFALGAAGLVALKQDVTAKADAAGAKAAATVTDAATAAAELRK